MVIEREALGVLPVVRDLPGVVIAHNVRRRRRAAHTGEAATASPAAGLGLADESVHAAAGDVVLGRAQSVGPPPLTSDES